jgi:predicted ATP-grasp superfamily ATP-dependent carboligase
MQGVPMSATFIANGKDALVLGINELIVRPIGERPHVYCGCVGPVEVPAGLAQRIGDAVRVLVIEFDLRGWCSLDFVRDGDSFGVLEVNPRPPASMALYAQRGLIDAQLRACLHAELPPPSAFATSQVAGSEIVYARRPMTIGAAGALHLQQWPMAHDLPAEGESFSAGDPLCSLSASGDSAGQVKALLAARCDALLDILETSP